MVTPNFRADNSDATTKNRRQPDLSENSHLERVKAALHALGPDRDVPWLARQTMTPPSTMYDNLRRGIRKADEAVKIAGALGVSVDWLLTGEGPGPGNDRAPTPALLARKRISSDDVVDQLGLKMIPEVDIAYSMGGGAVSADYIETRMVPFRRDWLDRLTRGFKADVFLSQGEGDSMTPTILDGDDVLVNRADNVIRHQDRIWALGYGELGMIKRVRRLPSGLFQLNSDNPQVTSIEATEEELFVVGRIIWIGRRV